MEILIAILKERNNMAASILKIGIMDNNFGLLDWQRSVIKVIDDYDELSGSEQMQELNHYDRAKSCAIRVCFPRRSGHTTLAVYLAKHYNASIIYTDTEHYREIDSQLIDNKYIELEKPFKDANKYKSDMVSVYHIWHDIIRSRTDYKSAEGLNSLKNILSNKKVIVIDMASLITERYTEVLDWLYNITNGIIVMLG